MISQDADQYIEDKCKEMLSKYKDNIHLIMPFIKNYLNKELAKFNGIMRSVNNDQKMDNESEISKDYMTTIKGTCVEEGHKNYLGANCICFSIEGKIRQSREESLNNENWLCCDECGIWYHMDCILDECNLCEIKTAVDENEGWICTKCNKLTLVYNSYENSYTSPSKQDHPFLDTEKVLKLTKPERFINERFLIKDYLLLINFLAEIEDKLSTEEIKKWQKIFPCSFEMLCHRKQIKELIKNNLRYGLMDYVRSELEKITNQFIFEDNFSDLTHNKIKQILDQQPRFDYYLTQINSKYDKNLKVESDNIYSFFEWLEDLSILSRKKSIEPQAMHEMYKKSEKFTFLSNQDKVYLKEAIAKAHKYWQWLQSSLNGQIKFYKSIEGVKDLNVNAILKEKGSGISSEFNSWTSFFNNKLDKVTIESNRDSIAKNIDDEFLDDELTQKRINQIYLLVTNAILDKLDITFSKEDLKESKTLFDSENPDKTNEIQNKDLNQINFTPNKSSNHEFSYKLSEESNNKMLIEDEILTLKDSQFDVCFGSSGKIYDNDNSKCSQLKNFFKWSYFDSIDDFNLWWKKRIQSFLRLSQGYTTDYDYIFKKCEQMKEWLKKAYDFKLRLETLSTKKTNDLFESIEALNEIVVINDVETLFKEFEEQFFLKEEISFIKKHDVFDYLTTKLTSTKSKLEKINENFAIIDKKFLEKHMKDGLFWEEYTLKFLIELCALTICQNYIEKNKGPCNLESTLLQIFLRCNTGKSLSQIDILTNEFSEKLNINSSKIEANSVITDQIATKANSLSEKLLEQKLNLNLDYLKSNEMYYEEAKTMLEGAIEMEQFSLNKNLQSQDFFKKIKERLITNDSIVQDSVHILSFLNENKKDDEFVFEEKWVENVKELHQRINGNNLRFDQRADIEKIIICINWLDRLKDLALQSYDSLKMNDREEDSQITYSDFISRWDFWKNHLNTQNISMNELSNLTHEKYGQKGIFKKFRNLGKMYIELGKYYYNCEFANLLQPNNKISVSILLRLSVRKDILEIESDGNKNEIFKKYFDDVSKFIDKVKKLKQGNQLKLDEFNSLVIEVYNDKNKFVDLPPSLSNELKRIDQMYIFHLMYKKIQSMELDLKGFEGDEKKIKE